MLMVELKRYILQGLICYVYLVTFFELNLPNVANEVVKDRRNKYSPRI